MKGYDNMKKIIFVFLLIIAICLPSCKSVLYDQEKPLKEQNSTLLYTHETVDTSTTVQIANDFGGAFLTTRKYRVRYYSVPYQFVLLVGKDAYDEWKTNINTENSDESNKMKIKNFVQYFNISREDFDRANLDFAKALTDGVDITLMMNPKDYADQEVDEIFNADIIYTFDDKIINEYYLSPDYPFGMRIEYENALERGEYQTKTTDWIDIEQMEAEIIAKYGEAEIMTETTVTSEEAVTIA